MAWRDWVQATLTLRSADRMDEAKRRAARGEMPYQRGGPHDRDADVRQLAAEMDQRVRQLTTRAPSIKLMDLALVGRAATEPGANMANH